ncbi:MAG: hypothetical protein CMM52_10180 [Rhodospirillaceae bacterium]|nr:hypothetical protein [Rhodospirillaceae bacterium]|tara:strand:- start:4526 stop:5113 length:588 start_codon:yes stop_codon:yes gene_type:complete
MKYLKILCITFVSTGLLAGCEATVQPKQFPELRYTHLPAISLAVGKVDVVQKYQSSTQKPHVESEFPVLPATAAGNWIRDRISAVGGPDTIRGTVTKASVVEVPLKRSSGIRGAFTKDQSERYDATLAVKIEIFDANGKLRGTVSSQATRSQTVSEDISLADREQVWFRMTEAMMNDLNGSLERQIREHFRQWLR